jgi:periplasmic protein TonB
MDMRGTGILYQTGAGFWQLFIYQKHEDMNAENILRSDLLDIIFENRNKQYGAYPLRKEYHRRLYLSMTIITSFVLLCYGGYYWQKQSAPGGMRVAGTVIVPETVLKKIEMLPTEPPQLQKKLAPVASITNNPPRIVPDNQVTDTATHTVADMDNKVISHVSADGPAAASDNQAASKAETAGPAAAPEAMAEPAVLDMAETMPEYPGGIPALIRFLGKNLQVPDNALEPGQKVRVPVKFVVNRDGVLSDVEFLAPTDPVFRKEILRVMAKMPRWKPGLQRGVAVAVYYHIPVIFDMGEN